MNQFEYEDSTGQPATYTDRKRYLWSLSVLFPLAPALTIAAFVQTGQGWVLWIPPVLLYLVAPALDLLLGQDEHNPPEEVVPQLEADRYYRILTYLTVPGHFITLAAGAWFIASAPASWVDYLGVTLSVGLVSGLAINTGHELGHKQTRLEQWLARIVLAIPGYGHFTVEHNGGHHTEVATPEDSASARYGENIYRFATREIPGGVRRAWRLETRRLERLGKSALGPGNTILQSYLLTAVIYLALSLALGPAVLTWLLLHAAIAWWQLTSANYIEHYGLLRQRQANGRYEPCKPVHSWNANHLFSNLLLFHLERHSDHHAHATRRYQSLRNFDDLPSLPSGYFGMFLVAYIPPLWRMIMHPRLMAHVDNDLSRVNTGQMDQLAPSA